MYMNMGSAKNVGATKCKIQNANLHRSWTGLGGPRATWPRTAAGSWCRCWRPPAISGSGWSPAFFSCRTLCWRKKISFGFYFVGFPFESIWNKPACVLLRRKKSTANGRTGLVSEAAYNNNYYYIFIIIIINTNVCVNGERELSGPVDFRRCFL